MLKAIKSLIANSVKVEVKEATQFGSFPVVVTDTNPNSFTNGWFLTYYVKQSQTGDNLYNAKDTFHSLGIARFSTLLNSLKLVDQQFLAGTNVVVHAATQRRSALYEYGPVRLYMRQEKEGLDVINMTITDENSPFYMMSIDFNIVISTRQENLGQRVIVGADGRLYNQSLDIFTEMNAQFASDKASFIRVIEDEGSGTLTINAQTAPSAKAEVSYVNKENSRIEKFSKITNMYKAMAYVYDKAISEHAFAIAQPFIKEAIAKAGMQQESQASVPFGGNPFSQPVGAGAPAQQFGSQSAPAFGNPPSGGGFAAFASSQPNFG